MIKTKLDSPAMRWPLQRDCAAFYGDPDPARRGTPSRLWEDENLVRFEPPYEMVLAWDTNQKVHTILFHRRAAGALQKCLTEITKHYSQKGIEQLGLHLYGGSYNFRMMRGSTSLSMHSYGCAIDLAPEQNVFGRRWVKNKGMMPLAVVDIFEAEGFVWGGRWRRPDAMHFQAARVR